jgi:CRP-like cAMP-binding protein
VTLPRRLRLEQFAKISSEDKQILTGAIVRTVTMRPDEELIRTGEEPLECYVILDGLLRRYKMLRDRSRQIIGFHIAGDFCDLNGPVIGRADHSISTVTDAKLAVIPRAALLEIIQQRPNIAMAFWKETIVDASIAREWVANVGRRSAYERIAHLICEIGRRLEAVGLAQNGNFELPLTQAEVADAMGLSIVHVNRIFQQLRSDGLLASQGPIVQVRDWHRLEEIGEFNPDYLFLSSGNQREQASL